jgi:ubiquinone/menaquinone biosynthesis C-methylase UbiE
MYDRILNIIRLGCRLVLLKTVGGRKEFLEELYELYACFYDEVIDTIPHREMMEEVAKNLVGKSVIDFGCGSGPLLYFVGDRIYTGIDLSEEMLLRAKQKASILGVNAKFIKGGVGSLREVRAATVVASMVLYSLENPEKVLRTFAEISGQVVITLPILPKGQGAVLSYDFAESLRRKGWQRTMKKYRKLPFAVLMVMIINLIINRMGNARELWFPELGVLCNAIRHSGLEIVSAKKTYANQAWLVVARKNGEGGRDER